jgi:hypothetical protein
MSNAKAGPHPPEPPPGRALGTVLSFIVPGLGQIVQGIIRKDTSRLTKGVFFLVSLWGMFFYGMAMGQWRNVYLPRYQDHLIEEERNGIGRRAYRFWGVQLPPLIGNLYTRLHYLGQFWIGAAAWPALWNYYFPGAAILPKYYPAPGAVPQGDDLADRRSRDLREFEAEANRLQTAMGRQWDIAWVYTVIAGVLNILVIYDAWAGPVHPRRDETAGSEPGEATA